MVDPKDRFMFVVDKLVGGSTSFDIKNVLIENRFQYPFNAKYICEYLIGTPYITCETVSANPFTSCRPNTDRGTRKTFIYDFTRENPSGPIKPVKAYPNIFRRIYARSPNPANHKTSIPHLNVRIKMSNWGRCMAGTAGEETHSSSSSIRVYNVHKTFKRTRTVVAVHGDRVSGKSSRNSTTYLDIKCRFNVIFMSWPNNREPPATTSQ